MIVGIVVVVVGMIEFVGVCTEGVADGRSMEMLQAYSWNMARWTWVVDLDSIQCSHEYWWNGSGCWSCVVVYRMGMFRSWHICVDDQVFGGSSENKSMSYIGIV